MTFNIPIFKIYWDQDDVEAVSKVITKGTYWATGPEISLFEKNLADYIGTDHALALNSGTSALHSLLLACDVRGKEVIVPTFTFIATVNAVLLAGGIPVFAESEAETYGLDVGDVSQKITANTAAIIVMHCGGRPARDTLKLKALAQQKNILLIEDAAQALGAEICGKKVGSFGDAAILSFCQNKIITTGEGGAVVTDNKEVYEKVKLLRSHGRVEGAINYFTYTGELDYILPGFNQRMPTMCAALGNSQLSKIDKIIAMRRKVANRYFSALSDISRLSLPREKDNYLGVYQNFIIRVEESIRDALRKHLEQKGIMTFVYFPPCHLKQLYRDLGCKEGMLPSTEQLAKEVLSLPIYPHISDEEMDYITMQIKDFYKSFKNIVQ